MRTSKAVQSAPEDQHEQEVDAEAGGRESTTFTSAGAIPAVSSGAEAEAGPSASELAFGDGRKDGGEALPTGVRAKFEGSLGADLSQVRVHTDGDAATTARRSGAKAVTTGQDIHFAHGQYDPASASGQELLAHEVAHTVQQKDATAPQSQRKAEVAPATHHAEADADQAASAMVAGKPATVSPLAEQAPHAEGDGSSWNALMNALRASLARQDWADVAIRLNGLSEDDIAWYVEKKMSYGQVAHVREAAPTAMPGYSQRVTDIIDRIDGNAQKIAAAYAAYEAAVKAGNWSEVANRLNGMGDWDIQDRLKKLDWSQLMAIRDATDNKRVIAAVDKADELRVQRAQKAYAEALAQQDWNRVAQQLNGMNDDGIASSINGIADSPSGIQKLGFLKAAAIRLMPTWHQRITSVIDTVVLAHGEQPPEPIPYTATVELPDVSDDVRQLKGTDLSSYAGNGKIADFAQKLAASFGARKAAKDKKPDKADEYTQIELARLEKSFASTGVAALNMGYKTFAGYAKDWMSEMRERDDALIVLGPGRWLHAPTWSQTELVELAKPWNQGDLGQHVHPFVNQFMAALGSDFKASTYPKHGGAEWAPFCVDLFPSIQRDERGLYQREPAMAFFERIHAAAQACGGDWMSCYNDATIGAAVNERLSSNRVDYSGTDGTGNWHGALKLHIHLYLTPPAGAPGSATSAPKVNPEKE